MATFPKPPTLNDDQRAVEIYRKAAGIIQEKGFDATSMGDIAEVADLTKGGLYYYIKGKEALLYAIMDFAMKCVEKRILTPADDVTDPVARLEMLISSHLGLALDEPAALIILTDETEALNARHRQAIDQRCESYWQVVLAAVSELLDSRGDQRDPEITARSLMAMLDGVVRWFDDGSMDPDRVVEQVTAQALYGLESVATARTAGAA